MRTKLIQLIVYINDRTPIFKNRCPLTIIDEVTPRSHNNNNEYCLMYMNVNQFATPPPPPKCILYFGDPLTHESAALWNVSWPSLRNLVPFIRTVITQFRNGVSFLTSCFSVRNVWEEDMLRALSFDNSRL
jgi:hypothetical protein